MVEPATRMSTVCRTKPQPPLPPAAATCTAAAPAVEAAAAAASAPAGALAAADCAPSAALAASSASQPRAREKACGARQAVQAWAAGRSPMLCRQRLAAAHACTGGGATCPQPAVRTAGQGVTVGCLTYLPQGKDQEECSGVEVESVPPPCALLPARLVGRAGRRRARQRWDPASRGRLLQRRADETQEQCGEERPSTPHLPERCEVLAYARDGSQHSQEEVGRHERRDAARQAGGRRAVQV